MQEKQRKYYSENSDLIQEKHRNYYYDNRPFIRDKQGQYYCKNSYNKDNDKIITCSKNSKKANDSVSRIKSFTKLCKRGPVFV